MRAFVAQAIRGIVLLLCAGHMSARGQSPTLSPADSPAANTRTNAATSRPQDSSSEVSAALNRRGDLNLHGLTLNSALFMIGEQWNVNIVAGELQGTVNGVFKQAPLREILDSILLSNGYNYQAVGDSLVIRSVTDLGQSSPSLQSTTISVPTANIDEVVDGARLLLTPQGKVQALKSARSIVVIDFPRQVQLVRQFVDSLEAGGQNFASPGSVSGAPLEVGYFKTQHIPARSAEQALTAVLSKSGRIGVMEREDTLVVCDYSENLAMIEKVLLRIDQPRAQVRITALIYDISLQDIENIGINWNQVGKANINGDGDAESSLGIDSIMQVPFDVGAAGSTLTFLNLSQHLDITAVAVLLANAKDARLMGNPNVAVIDNEEAIFQSVAEIPFQQLTQTSAGGQIGTTSFKEAGITLRVKPKIAADGTIAMQVMPEFSRLTGFTPGDNQPIIDRRTASTVLRVCDRQTVVIGGLRQRSDIGDFKGVPYLKDIPGVGRVFRSRDTDVRESELVVFIMPEIIGPADIPSPRNQLLEDTLNCRLDQIPLAEGCPPNCRRLPYDPAMGTPIVEECGALIQPTANPPVQQAVLVPSVRRLPMVVPTQPSVVAGSRPGLFSAPTTNPPRPAYNARRPMQNTPIPR